MIGSDPDEIHVYNVADFESLNKIVEDLTTNLCNSVKGPGKVSPGFPSSALEYFGPDNSYFGWGWGEVTLLCIVRCLVAFLCLAHQKPVASSDL